MKSLLISIFLLATTAVFSQDPDKTVTLKASGSGTTQEQAKNNALRSAVEQAYGAFISSKTEILNDQVVADEIVSVASGNIQAFKILEEQHTDSLDFCLLEAVVSISKLTSFAQSKGYAVEVKGGLFALNIKQKQLNESAEIVAVTNALSTALEILSHGFDFKIITSEPTVNDPLKGDWKIAFKVTTVPNNNYIEGHKIIRATLENIGMSDSEIAEYKSLQKSVYEVVYHFPDNTETKYCLRTSEGLWAFIRLALTIPTLTQSFKVSDGLRDYKTGFEWDYKNISKTEYHPELLKMINQYTRINLGGINEEWYNPIFTDAHGGAFLADEHRDRLYYNDAYYEYNPVLCVERLDFFEIYSDKISFTLHSLTYSIDEISSLNEIKVEHYPLEIPKKYFRPIIPRWYEIDFDFQNAPPASDTRPFILDFPIDSIDSRVYDQRFIDNYKVDGRYIRNISSELLNRDFITAYLEVASKDLNRELLKKKGGYRIGIEYVVETNGSIDMIDVTYIDFFSNNNVSKFLELLDKVGFPNNQEDWNYLRLELSKDDISLITNWIITKIKELKNHPTAITKPNDFYVCKTLRCRTFLTSEFCLYVN